MSGTKQEFSWSSHVPQVTSFVILPLQVGNLLNCIQEMLYIYPVYIIQYEHFKEIVGIPTEVGIVGHSLQQGVTLHVGVGVGRLTELW